MLCEHDRRCLKYILFTFQFTSVLCKPLHRAGPLHRICQIFVFLSILGAFYDTVSFHQAFLPLQFLSAITQNVNLAGPQQGREQGLQ